MLLATFVNHPDLTRSFLRFNFYLLFRSTLPDRGCANWPCCGSPIARDCAYEWRHHVAMGDEGRPHRRRHRRAPARRGRRRIRPRGPHRGRRTRRQVGHLRRDVGGPRRAPRRAPTHGPRLHHRLLCTARHGHQHLRRRTRPGEVELIVAFFPKPGAGSWTENWPELGTAPVNYDDSIDPEHFKLEQQAIFKKTWLKVGRVEQLPKKGSYFTREMPSVGPGTSVIIVKDEETTSIRALLQPVPPPRQQAGVERLSRRGGVRHLPPVHLQVPRLALRLNGDLTFVQQEGEFFDLDKARLRAGPRALRGVGRLHLHQLRQRRRTAGRVPRRLRQGPRGVSRSTR